VAAVKKRGRSERGEKTMLDVLVPVQLAWEQAARTVSDREAIERVKRAAKEGLESTRPLQATKAALPTCGSEASDTSIPALSRAACWWHAVCDVFLESTKP